MALDRLYPTQRNRQIVWRRGKAAPDKGTDMKLLHIDSSALGANSVTRELSAAVVAQWQAAVPEIAIEYRDLDAQPVAHLSGQTLSKSDPHELADAERVLAQFQAADVVVIGAPMYNFTVPSTLKAWIDRIAVAGKTFRYGANGPEGLAGGTRVIVASGRGGVHTGASSDFQEPYLRHVFGFLGIAEVEFVRAEGVAFSPEHRVDALAAAKAAIGRPLQEAA